MNSREMMWLDPTSNTMGDDSDVESDSSGEEIPIWVRGEQRWVSGVVGETTCQDVITILLQDEETRVSKSIYNFFEKKYACNVNNLNSGLDYFHLITMPRFNYVKLLRGI